MDWKSIPSLSALRAFEAAARLCNFSAAARELNVTHAAISQHVRHLETHFGQALIIRQGRKLVLTEKGRHLAHSLSDGFGTIASGISALVEDLADQPLKVTLTPAFAENWLMPRLGEFWMLHPGVEIALFPSLAVADIKQDGFDLAIRFGDGNWPGLSATRLTSPHYMVVAAPKLVADRKSESVAELADLPWLFEPRYQEQKLLAAELGIEFEADKLLEVATSGLLLSAARAGHGVAILPTALTERDIAEGTLVKLLKTPVGNFAYYLVTHSAVPSKKLQLFLNWLNSYAEPTT